MDEAEKLLSAALSSSSSEDIDNLICLLSTVNDLSFLKQLSNSLMLKITAADNRLSTVDLTEWLLNITQEQVWNSLNLLWLKNFVDF